MIQTKLVLAVALINFLAGFLGVVLILLNIRWSDRNLRWGIGFGAGLLIGLSFLEILPAAMEFVHEQAMIFVLLGFMGFFLIERFIRVHRFEEVSHEGAHFHFSKATFLALCIHATLDGIVIGLGLHLNETLGMIVVAAILFHKLPLAVSVASLFLGNVPKRSAVIQMLGFALATPAGLLAAVAVLGGIPEHVIGSVVALSAGIFLYLGATDMLPEIMHAGHGLAQESGDEIRGSGTWRSWEPTLWVFIGIGASLLPQLLGLHVHQH